VRGDGRRGAVPILSRMHHHPLRISDAIHLSVVTDLGASVLATADGVQGKAGKELSLDVEWFGASPWTEVASPPLSWSDDVGLRLASGRHRLGRRLSVDRNGGVVDRIGKCQRSRRTIVATILKRRVSGAFVAGVSRPVHAST
jgi:hypothetical protein